MKQVKEIVVLSTKQKNYIENLPVPGRQGSPGYAPTKKLPKFSTAKQPANLLDSMDDVDVTLEKINFEILCGMSCINIQRDVPAHKEKLLGYLLSGEVNLSTMSKITAVNITDTNEILINDGNTRIAVCRDELRRERYQHKKRRFKIPEYFNVEVHKQKNQAKGEQSYKTYDNNNAVETKKQQITGALHSYGHRDWLSHPILQYCSYGSAMRDILILNGHKKAGDMSVFQLLDIFEHDLQHVYDNYQYEMGNNKANRFLFALFGLRLVYKNDERMLKKVDKFLHEAINYNPLKSGLYGQVGAGMFHNEFVNVVVANMRYMRKRHVSTDIKLTFGVVLEYFEGWLNKKSYKVAVPDNKEDSLKRRAIEFFQEQL